MKQQCEAICETVETLGPDRKIHHPRWQCSNNGRYKHDGKMYCGTHHNKILRACKLRDASKGVSDAKAIAETAVNEVVARNLSEQRELIASWAEEMCQGLDANAIAEAIRNGGNDAIDNFKVSK